MKKIIFILVTILLFNGCGKRDIEKKIEQLIKAKDFENAIKLLDEKIKENPSNDLYRILKTKVYSRSGNIELAFKEYERYYLLKGKINKELLKELGLSPLNAQISPYKFMVLLTLADFREIPEDIKKIVRTSLSDGDETVRVGACWLAGRQKIKEWEKDLIRLTSDGRSIVSWNAIWALGEIREEKSFNTLSEILDNAKDPSIITETINALGKFRDKNALIKLRRFLNHPGKHLSTASLAAVEYIEKGSIKDTYYFIKNQKDEQLLGFLYLLIGEYKQKELYNEILSVLKDKNAKFKENAIRAFGEIGNEKDLHILKPYLISKNQTEKIHAYFSSYKLGLKDYEIYKKGLDDSSVEIRRISAIALGQSKDKDVEKILHDRLLKAPILDKVFLSLALIQ
ncbi:MAG: HEAT repeat domain-containing protein [Proteobacteria bacterium]|nr:HEAT repeat domain-containing protein [Pseudomonadota bacterium]